MAADDWPGERQDRTPNKADDARAVSPGTVHLDDLLRAVARGDDRAYEAVYGQTASWVLGVVRRVLRDPAQSEEVMQEVMLDVWRSASRFDPAIGSGTAWIMTLAHRRAVDRVRAERSLSSRERRAAVAEVDYDDAAESALASLERERVRRCLEALTALQDECVRLAYYNGYTYREVARLLGVPEGTVKTRMRDGLIRLRDCLDVQ